MEFHVFQQHLALNFRSHRVAAQLNQSALARRAGVTTQWISEIETAKGRPSLDTLLRLAEAMGTTVSALTHVPPDQPDAVEGLEELIAELRQLPPGALALTRGYVRGLRDAAGPK